MAFGFEWWMLFMQVYHRRGPGTIDNESPTHRIYDQIY